MLGYSACGLGAALQRRRTHRAITERVRPRAKGRNSLAVSQKEAGHVGVHRNVARRVTIVTQRFARGSGVALAVAVLAGGEPGKGFELAAERAVVGVAAAQGNFGDRQFAG